MAAGCAGESLYLALHIRQRAPSADFPMEDWVGGVRAEDRCKLFKKQTLPSSGPNYMYERGEGAFKSFSATKKYNILSWKIYKGIIHKLT